MASPIHHPESPATLEPPRVRFEPVRFHHTLLDGSWWPGSTDLGAELRALVPALDHVRGPVKRLLLSAANWSARPSQIIAAGRAVSVGYLAGQSPSLMTVLCADGGVFTMRVAPPGPAPSAPNEPDERWEEDAWETEGGGLNPSRYPAAPTSRSTGYAPANQFSAGRLTATRQRRLGPAAQRSYPNHRNLSALGYPEWSVIR